MKQFFHANFKNWVILVVLSFWQIISFAQDSTDVPSQNTTTTTRTTTETQTWYMQPWAWVAGVLIFIIILFLVLRGGSGKQGSTDKVTVTRSVRRETDSD